MMGHASWNGTLTIFAIYATNSGMSEITAIVLTICIMILMVVGILVIGSGLLQSVREAPDGSEVDDYQAQLASMGNQKF
jgi:hypothetical protein